MKLVMKEEFAKFYEEQIVTREGRTLISRMQGLETYPPPEGVTLVGDLENDYGEAKKQVEILKEEGLKKDLTEPERIKETSLVR